MENELLLENISEQVKVFYVEKVLGKLKTEDCELLRCYFGNDMSLQKNGTADVPAQKQPPVPIEPHLENQRLQSKRIPRCSCAV